MALKNVLDTNCYRDFPVAPHDAHAGPLRHTR